MTSVVYYCGLHSRRGREEFQDPTSLLSSLIQFRPRHCTMTRPHHPNSHLQADEAAMAAMASQGKKVEDDNKISEYVFLSYRLGSLLNGPNFTCS